MENECHNNVRGHQVFLKGNQIWNTKVRKNIWGGPLQKSSIVIRRRYTKWIPMYYGNSLSLSLSLSNDEKLIMHQITMRYTKGPVVPKFQLLCDFSSWSLQWPFLVLTNLKWLLQVPNILKVIAFSPYKT